MSALLSITDVKQYPCFSYPLGSTSSYEVLSIRNSDNSRTFKLLENGLATSLAETALKIDSIGTEISYCAQEWNHGDISIKMFVTPKKQAFYYVVTDIAKRSIEVFSEEKKVLNSDKKWNSRLYKEEPTIIPAGFISHFTIKWNKADSLGGWERKNEKCEVGIQRKYKDGLFGHINIDCVKKVFYVERKIGKIIKAKNNVWMRAIVIDRTCGRNPKSETYQLVPKNFAVQDAFPSPQQDQFPMPGKDDIASGFYSLNKRQQIEIVMYQRVGLYEFMPDSDLATVAVHEIRKAFIARIKPELETVRICRAIAKNIQVKKEMHQFKALPLYLPSIHIQLSQGRLETLIHFFRALIPNYFKQGTQRELEQKDKINYGSYIDEDAIKNDVFVFKSKPVTAQANEEAAAPVADDGPGADEEAAAAAVAREVIVDEGVETTPFSALTLVELGKGYHSYTSIDMYIDINRTNAEVLVNQEIPLGYWLRTRQLERIKE